MQGTTILSLAGWKGCCSLTTKRLSLAMVTMCKYLLISETDVVFLEGWVPWMRCEWVHQRFGHSCGVANHAALQSKKHLGRTSKDVLKRHTPDNSIIWLVYEFAHLTLTIWALTRISICVIWWKVGSTRDMIYSSVETAHCRQECCDSGAILEFPS